MENKVPEGAPASSEGSKAESQDVNQLKKELEAVKAELQKQREIKEQISREQVEKNQRARTLKEEREALQAQLNKLQSDFDAARVELDSAKSYRERVEQEKKAQLEALKASIPESKRSLIVDDLPIDKQLDFIHRNNAILFGDGGSSINQQSTGYNPFTVPRPNINQQVIVTLSEDEKSLIKGRINEEAALELKTRNPSIFQQFLKRK